MRDVTQEIDPASNVKRNAPRLLRELKATGHPIVLTINGEVELLVEDPEFYQTLIELAERSERLEALRESVEDMKAGRVSPASDMLAEMRQIFLEKQAQ